MFDVAVMAAYFLVHCQGILLVYCHLNFMFRGMCIHFNVETLPDQLVRIFQ